MKTKIEYVNKIIRDQGFKFFCIYDERGNLVYNQRNESFSPEKAIEEIADFLAYNEGSFRIELRSEQETDERNKRTYISYHILNFDTGRKEGDEKSQIMLSGLQSGMPSGNEIFQLYQQKEVEIRTLHAQILNDKLDAIQKQNELSQLIMMKEAELKSKGKDDSFKEIAIMGLQSLFGGGMNVGVTGINDEAPTDKDRINSAIRTLLKVDPDFVPHIESLAKLAIENPSVYQMAVSQLNNLK